MFSLSNACAYCRRAMELQLLQTKEQLINRPIDCRYTRIDPQVWALRRFVRTVDPGAQKTCQPNVAGSIDILYRALHIGTIG